MSTGYAMTAPLGSAPDEPEHWRYAWTLASDLAPVDGFVRVPEALAGFPGSCYNEKPQETPACAPDIVESDRTVPDPIRFWGYPRPYYELVGIPIAWSPDSSGLLWARVISAALGAGAWTLAFAPWVRRTHWPMRAALAVGVTPLAIYFNGTVNPQGLEIASMAAVWSLTLAFFLSLGRTTPRWLLVAWPVAVLVALFARPLTWLWIGTALGCCAVATVVRPASLFRRRGSWFSTLAVIAALSAFVAITVWNRLRSPLAGVALVEPEFDVPLGQQLAATAWRGLEQLEESIGLLGWLDVPLPAAVTGVWFLVTGLVVGISLTVARRWQVIAAGLCLLVLLVVWAVTDPIITQQVGIPFWQGRYGAPLLMGVPLLVGAATVLSPPRGLRRAISVGCVLALSIAQLIAIGFLAVRYMWGAGWDGPVGAPLWTPALDPVAIAGIFVLGLVAFMLAVGVVVRSSDVQETSGAAGEGSAIDGRQRDLT